MRPLPPALLALALFAPGAARAAEGELVLALEPGYTLVAEAEPRHGVSIGASLAVGVTDLVWLTAAGGVSHALSGEPARDLFEAGAGLTVALDVLRVVPFAELLAGVVADGEHLAPTLRAGLGADYLLSPRWSVGGVARYRALPAELARDGWFSLELRLALRLEP